MGMAAVLFCASVAAIVLRRFPPELYGFYPQCPVHEYLGVLCPGCGGTRAIAALLQGRFWSALQSNALVTVGVLPLSVIYLAGCFTRARRGGEYRWPSVPTVAVYAGLIFAAGFAVMRNL